jgi:hypothetical protein
MTFLHFRPAVILAAAASAMALSVAPFASPATADEAGGTLISLDGLSYSEAPSGSIFPAGVVMVPGASATGSFFVRNDSDRAADLRISVSDTTSGSATFIESLTLKAETHVTSNARPVALESGGTCTPLLSGELLASGATTEVAITLAMLDSLGNADQGSSADTTLMVSLRDPDAPESATTDCVPGGGIPLTPDPVHPGKPGTTAETVGGSGAAPSPDGNDTDDASGSPQTDGDDATASPDTPTSAASPPILGGGQPVLFPWMGLGTIVLGAGLFLGIRHRKRQAE